MDAKTEQTEMAAQSGRENRAVGVWAPALTPVDASLGPDGARYAELVVKLLGDGCHGVVVFGTTGEANSFSAAERMAVLEAAVNAGAPAGRLMAGTGLCNFPETIQLTAHALSLGVRSVLMLPPFYFKNPSDQGLFDAYARIIDGVADSRLRIYLYHFPKLSGVPIPHGLIEKLVAAYPDTIAGIKDSTGDWQSTSDLIQRFPGLAVFPGSEILLLPALRAGGAGCITATANVNAPAIRRTYDAWAAGDDGAEDLQDAISRVRAAFDQRPLVPVLKNVVSRRTGHAGWLRVRPPFTPLEETESEKAMADLSAAGLAI